MSEDEQSSTEETAAESGSLVQEASGDYGGEEQEKEASSEQSLAAGATDSEEKPEGADGAEKPENEDEKKPEGAPEDYESFTIPEGLGSDRLNPAFENAYKQVAKEFNWTQTQAQSFLDKMIPVIAERNAANEKEIVAGWVKSVKEDKEVGGGRFKEAMANVARIRDRFAKNEDGQFDSDIADLINSPFGNHPGLIKLLSRAGAAMGEAGFPTGAPSAPEPTATDFYNSAKKRG